MGIEHGMKKAIEVIKGSFKFLQRLLITIVKAEKYNSKSVKMTATKDEDYYLFDMRKVKKTFAKRSMRM